MAWVLFQNLPVCEHLSSSLWFYWFVISFAFEQNEIAKYNRIVFFFLLNTDRVKSRQLNYLIVLLHIYIGNQYEYFPLMGLNLQFSYK